MAEKINAIQTIGTSNLVKIAHYNTNIREIEKKIPNHDIYITTQEFNKLTADNFVVRLAQAT